MLGLALACALLAFAPLSPREGRFDSGGVSIRYLDAGRGDAVVLVHGFGGSAEEWTRAGVLGITGTADSALGEVKATAAAKPNMRVLEIDGASHEQAIGRPELAAAVRSFLAGLKEHSGRKGS